MMAKARALAVLPLAALLAIGAVRAMTFVAPGNHPLRALQPVFDGHPKALADRAMAEIGTAAARGGAVPPSARQAMAAVARNAPLSPDPFLVEGTVAEMAGKPDRSERLFLAARNRAPRSEAARYFLADRYLKTNRILAGLIEMGALARLSQKASQPLAPALAAYARSPGAITELKRYFALSPAVRDSTLGVLAEDARNAPLVLALAPEPRPGASPADWHGRLVQSLVTAGDFDGAEAIWARVAGVANRGPLYNPQFRDLPGPPPFNWSYASGRSGVAEASGSGGLDVIYYGREDVTLAGQLLRLAPGRYRLSMRIDGPSRATGVSWTVQCVPGNAVLLQLPLDAVDQGSIAGSFAVPAAGCAAQSFELRGRPSESSTTAQLTILDLALAPVAMGR